MPEYIKNACSIVNKGLLKLVNILNKYSKKNMDANADIVNDDDVVDGAGFQYSNVPILTPLYN